MLSVTIGIVTYKREKSFKKLIHSLCKSFSYSSIDDINFEIIIVDNSNQAYPLKILNSSNLNIPYRVYSFDGGSASKGRNEIIAKSESDYIAFLDDDLIVAQDYIFELHKSIQNIEFDTEISGICGDIIREVEKESVLDRAFLDAHLAHYFTYENNLSLARRFKRVKWCPTANVVVKRKNIIIFNEFDKIPVGGEDVVWGIEINNTCGTHFICSPSLTVYHDSLSSNAECISLNIEKSYHYGMSEAAIAKYLSLSFPSTLQQIGTCYKYDVIIKSFFIRLIYSKKYVSYLYKYNLLSVLMLKNILQSNFIVGNILYSIKNSVNFKTSKLSLTKLSQS